MINAIREYHIVVHMEVETLKEKTEASSCEIFKGINHTGIYVRDIDKAIKFYTDVLGFSLKFKIYNESDGETIAMLDLGGALVEVLQPPMIDETTFSGAKDTVNHIAITVSDIEESVAHVQSCGYEIEKQGIEDVFRFGEDYLDLKIAFFRGPNNERIELFQEIR
jgi:catechol 2,3-dioxygenase-like lactoylglutathione lyase family enzyme